MSTTLVEKNFNILGARAKFKENERILGTIRIDIKKDKEGEFFDIQTNGDPQILVMDIQKKDRHLLLLARDEKKRPLKFLCGHDERHWFTCAIPGGVSTVFQAKEALKPTALKNLESGNIKTKDKQKRHRKLKGVGTVHRQGEFMFIPRPNYVPAFELKNEPLSRGAGKPHMAQFISRIGGELVYVNYLHPNGLTQDQYNALSTEQKKLNWSRRFKDARVYAKGKISHADHATLDLGNVWHEVLVNTEDKARGALNIAFLD